MANPQSQVYKFIQTIDIYGNNYYQFIDRHGFKYKVYSETIPDELKFLGDPMLKEKFLDRQKIIATQNIVQLMQMKEYELKHDCCKVRRDRFFYQYPLIPKSIIQFNSKEYYENHVKIVEQISEINKQVNKSYKKSCLKIYEKNPELREITVDCVGQNLLEIVQKIKPSQKNEFIRNFSYLLEEMYKKLLKKINFLVNKCQIFQPDISFQNIVMTSEGKWDFLSYANAFNINSRAKMNYFPKRSGLVFEKHKFGGSYSQQQFFDLSLKSLILTIIQSIMIVYGPNKEPLSEIKNEVISKFITEINYKAYVQSELSQVITLICNREFSQPEHRISLFTIDQDQILQTFSLTDSYTKEYQNVFKFFSDSKQETKYITQATPSGSNQEDQFLTFSQLSCSLTKVQAEIVNKFQTYVDSYQQNIEYIKKNLPSYYRGQFGQDINLTQFAENLVKRLKITKLPQREDTYSIFPEISDNQIKPTKQGKKNSSDQVIINIQENDYLIACAILKHNKSILDVSLKISEESLKKHENQIFQNILIAFTEDKIIQNFTCSFEGVNFEEYQFNQLVESLVNNTQCQIYELNFNKTNLNSSQIIMLKERLNNRLFTQCLYLSYNESKFDLEQNSNFVIIAETDNQNTGAFQNQLNQQAEQISYVVEDISEPKSNEQNLKYFENKQKLDFDNISLTQQSSSIQEQPQNQPKQQEIQPQIISKQNQYLDSNADTIHKNKKSLTNQQSGQNQIIQNSSSRYQNQEQILSTQVQYPQKQENKTQENTNFQSQPQRSSTAKAQDDQKSQIGIKAEQRANSEEENRNRNSEQNNLKEIKIQPQNQESLEINFNYERDGNQNNKVDTKMTSDAINTNNNNKDFHQDNEQNLSSVDNEQQAGEALSFDKQIDFNRGSKLSEEIFKKDASNQDKTFQAILDNLGESRNNSNINNLIKENVSSNGQNNQKDNANQNENSQQNQQQNSDSDQQNLERNVSANFEDKQNIEQIKFQRQERVEEQNLLKSQNLSQLGSEIQYQENNSQMLSSSFLQQVNQDFVLEKSQIQDLSNPDEQIKPNKFLTKEEIQILKEDFDVTHETQQQKALSQVNNYVSGQIQQDQQRESQLIQDQQREQLLVPSKKENDENKQSNNEGKVNENPIKESQIQNDMKYLNQEQSQNQELNDTLLKSFNQEVIEQNQIIQEEISSSKLMNNNFEFDRNFGQEEPRKDIEKGQLYLIKENISVTKDSVSQLQSVQFQDQIRQDSFNQTNQIHQIQDQQKDFKKNQIDKNDVSVTFEQNTSAQQQSENRQTDLGVEKKLQKDFKINQVEKDNVSVTFEQNTSVEQLNQNRQTDLDSQKQNLLESEQKSQEKKQESENNEIQHSIQDSNPKMNFTNDQMPQNELQNNSELFTQEIQDSVQDKYGQQHEVEIIKENDENQSHQVISSDQSYLNNQEFGQQQTQYRFEEISEQISQKYQGQDDDSEEN